MANRVNAAPTEHASVDKTEHSKEAVDTQPSSEVDNRTQDAVAFVDCTAASKASPKHSMEGNGDGKTVRPGKDTTTVAGKGGSTAKSSENEVFVPAPPPATNAWTKRMQASCSAAKPAAESASVDDKLGTGRLPSDSNKPAPPKKQSPNRTVADHSAKSDAQLSRFRLECSTQTESTSAAAVTSGKHASGEDTENPSSSKRPVEVRPKLGSEASTKAEGQAKTTSSTLDSASGGCWKKPATAAQVQSVCEASVAQGSSATKQHSTEQSAGELFTSCC